MSAISKHILGLKRTQEQSRAVYEVSLDSQTRKIYLHKADLLKDLQEHVKHATNGFNIIAEVDEGRVFSELEVLLDEDGYKALTTT